MSGVLPSRCSDRKGRRPLAGRVGVVIAFILVLLVASAAPVLADDPSIVDPRTTAPTPRDDPERVFDGGVVPVEFEAYEREVAERERWLASSEAVQQRRASQLAYSDLDADASETSLRDTFAEQLSTLNADSGRLLSNAKLTRPIGMSAGAVEDDGEHLLLDGTIPLRRARGEDGDLEKVDLTLKRTAQGFEAQLKLGG